ncbi:DinB family protein [Schlesneria paludicola]|uniref:DinB family protein n=1 Tax=Schlesneria paludicola TaxID=360056 RepID=UPI00029AAB42|nr:DinB family protein [Schlesneria paludicola]
MSSPAYLAHMQSDDGSLSAADLIATYEEQIDLLRAAVSGLTTEQLRARPIAGKWSTLEVVCHLTDCELYFSERMIRTIALERPLLISVDEGPYPERLNYQSLDINEQLELFTALRRHVARSLKAQPVEGWQRSAVHSGLGLVTLRKLVLYAIRHISHHLPFIAEKRAALK